MIQDITLNDALLILAGLAGCAIVLAFLVAIARGIRRKDKR